MNESAHISHLFDQELERLRTSVLAMGGLIEAQIDQAAMAYGENDAEAVQRVLDADKRVNLLEKEIDNDCVHIIARRQPAASDLRLVMGVSKIVTDLERAGDEAKKIAKGVRRIQANGQRIQSPDAAEVRHLAQVAIDLLRRSLDAFARLDIETAFGVIRDDAELDREFKSLVRQLITYMMEDPRSISVSMDIITIARAIERAGDHAKSISQQVVFIVEGQDIRHAGKEKAE